MRKFIFIFSVLCLETSSSYLDYIYDTHATVNNFGEVGLILLPSAEIADEGTVRFTLNRNDIYKFGSLSVTPFSWLEASYFYYRPYDLMWKRDASFSTKGLYLDKGFSVKLSSKNIYDSHTSFAIGLSDFAGTGLFSREYILSTTNIKNFKITAGLGWGRIAGENTLNNPLNLISNRFGERSLEAKDRGGALSYYQWFRGDVAPLLGFEYSLARLKGVKIKIENNPISFFSFGCCGGGLTPDSYQLRKKTNDFNFGLTKRFRDQLEFEISYINGEILNLSFTFGGNFSKPFFKKKNPNNDFKSSGRGQDTKLSFHEDLIYNLNSKGIFLQSSEISENSLIVSVASNKFRDPIQVHKIVGGTALAVKKNSNLPLEDVTTVNTNVGNELHRISTPIDYFAYEKETPLELVIQHSEISAGRGSDYKRFEFQPTIKYPASFTGVAPALLNHIGDPAKFIFTGLAVRLDNEIQFSSKLILKTELFSIVADNFDEARNQPDSQLPNVRTGVVRYLQDSRDYVARMQLDYFFSPYKEIYGKLSTGILENMYAGSGFEFLYKPFEENFSIGIEAYKVRQRGFDRKFELLDYETNTAHLNFNYHLPNLGVLGTLSYGKYLANDTGFTFDISRQLRSGFRAGIFFSRTNVPARIFGEGSFDKGFYFQIPIDLFLSNYRGGYINFKLRPLTRDGGQKLEPGRDLIGIIHNSSYSEIERYWTSFND